MKNCFSVINAANVDPDRNFTRQPTIAKSIVSYFAPTDFPIHVGLGVPPKKLFVSIPNDPLTLSVRIAIKVV